MIDPEASELQPAVKTDLISLITNYQVQVCVKFTNAGQKSW